MLPPPVAADLNGDGRVEVITATHDAKLQVVSLASLFVLVSAEQVHVSAQPTLSVEPEYALL